MLWSGFILGFISSLHCFGMCAPLQVVALHAGGKNTPKRYLVLYHFSRIIVYATLGILAGIAGKSFGLQAWQQETSLISGLLLLFAFAAFYLLKLDRKLLKMLFPYLSRMRGTLQKNKQAKSFYFIGSGTLNGLLPCGMVYLALFPAMGSESWYLSGLYMFVFGLGTLPLLVISNLGGLRILQYKGSFVQKLIPVMVFATAVLLILRGMDLGIPYISPKTAESAVATMGCK